MWPAIELSSMCKPLCKLCSSSRDDRDESEFAYFGLIKVSEVGDFFGHTELVHVSSLRPMSLGCHTSDLDISLRW